MRAWDSLIRNGACALVGVMCRSHCRMPGFSETTAFLTVAFVGNNSKWHIYSQNTISVSSPPNWLSQVSTDQWVCSDTDFRYASEEGGVVEGRAKVHELKYFITKEFRRPHGEHAEHPKTTCSCRRDRKRERKPDWKGAGPRVSHGNGISRTRSRADGMGG